jgi:hypothetical protein
MTFDAQEWARRCEREDAILSAYRVRAAAANAKAVLKLIRKLGLRVRLNANGMLVLVGDRHVVPPEVFQALTRYRAEIVKELKINKQRVVAELRRLLRKQ